MIKIILRPRAGGKTTELIKFAAEHNLVIACSTTRQCKLVAEMAEAMKCQILSPIRIQDVSHRLQGLRVAGIAVDNVSSCLTALIGEQVAAITETGENND
jgi:hypothetical protein